jgi:hypothetical protein
MFEILWKLIEKILPDFPPDMPERLAVSDPDYISACTIGGAIAGLFLSGLVVFLKELNGFVGIPLMQSSIMEIIMVIGGFGCGILAGRLMSRYALARRYSKNSIISTLWHSIILFSSGFFLLVCLHQLAARDALVEPGKSQVFLRDRITDEPLKDPQTGIRIFRWGGGPFGEPDFETIATGIVGGLGLIFLASSLSKYRYLIPSRKEIGRTAIGTAVVSMISWSVVVVIYWLLNSLVFHNLQTGRTATYVATDPPVPTGSFVDLPPVLIAARWVFVADFPHPKRVWLFGILTLAFVMIVLVTILFRASLRKSRRKTTSHNSNKNVK